VKLTVITAVDAREFVNVTLPAVVVPLRRKPMTPPLKVVADIRTSAPEAVGLFVQSVVPVSVRVKA